MTAADYLDAVQALANAATEGPWEAGVEKSPILGTFFMLRGAAGRAVRLRDGLTVTPNAEFIAHARTDVPRLVAALRAVLGVEQDLARWAEANRSFSEDPSAPPHEWIYHDAYAEAGRQLRVAIEAAIGGAS